MNVHLFNHCVQTWSLRIPSVDTYSNKSRSAQFNTTDTSPNYAIFSKRNIQENGIFETRLAGIAQRDEGGGRILPGDNTRRGSVVLRPINFQCLRICFHLESFIPVYILYIRGLEL